MRNCNVCAIACTMAAVVLGGLSVTANAQLSEEEKARQSEQEARFEAYFKEKDSNGDGKLTVEEATSGVEANRAEWTRKWFAAIDGDKDGSVTLAEAKEWSTKFRAKMNEAEQKFTAMDTNADGKVSLAEATTGKTGQEAQQATTDFEKMDADKDGFATKEELRRNVFRLSTEEAAK